MVPKHMATYRSVSGYSFHMVERPQTVSFHSVPFCRVFRPSNACGTGGKTCTLAGRVDLPLPQPISKGTRAGSSPAQKKSVRRASRVAHTAGLLASSPQSPSRRYRSRARCARSDMNRIAAIKHHVWGSSISRTFCVSSSPEKGF
jgi:hypothetical protein